MYNTAHFSRMPRANIPGTRMKKPQIVVGTSLHGKIVPLFCNMVMPGQVDSNFANGVIWMSNPIHPLLTQIKGKINVFYVPIRLLWEHWKEFNGENTQASGPQTQVYKIPMGTASGTGSGSPVGARSVSHYLGKPITTQSNANTNMSVLKERAFWLVYSEYYRHEQTMNPVLLNRSDNTEIGTLDGNDLDFGTECPNCLKDFDYYTTATISPTFGGEVLLPLGSLAPVIMQDVTGQEADDLSTVNDLKVVGNTSTASLFKFTRFGLDGAGDADVTANLYADLSQATAAKLDDLYTAMAANAWYHNANYGARYFESIEVHYGVSNPDLVVERPEHVSEFTFDIVVQDVVSTAGAAADDSTTLGQPGAVSKTIIRKKLYNHSFGEWGFVIGLMNTYHQRYYSAGIAREDLYEDLFDFYFPEFANRSDDSIFDDEIYFGAGRGTFGFQEAYADRRYYINRVTGDLDPQLAAPLGPWVLAEKYSSKPTLSKSFLEENRDAIKEALVSGEDGPDYIWSFNFEHKEILPMPAYSKPGIPRFGRV